MQKQDVPNQFPMSFTGENTLVVPLGSDFETVFTKEFKKFDTKGKTIIITDTYIFRPGKVADYQNKLLRVLRNLESRKIIFVRYKDEFDKKIKVFIEQKLKNDGVDVEHKKLPIHDRYWICAENEEGFQTPSLNGVGVNIASLSPMSKEDCKDIIKLAL